MAFHPIAADDDDCAVGVARPYAWIVFALTFGLLISDYMSRQVLNAVFPMLKGEWALSDGQLGLLSGIVALMVGLLTFPLSLLADRFGRVKSLALMALLWSLATLGCAVAQDYQQMFIARFMVGVGEAAYGSVGIAVVISVFPKHLRATLASAFMAGGMFGSVLGMALGGAIAAKLGWRWSFAGMALFGLLLAVLYPVIVKEARIAPQRAALAANKAAAAVKRPLRTLFSSRSVIAAYIGSGLQLFVGGTVIVWMPSYLNRYYDMATDKAGGVAAIIVLCSGAGMILCGMLSDRLSSPFAGAQSHFGHRLLPGQLPAVVGGVRPAGRACAIGADLPGHVDCRRHDRPLRSDGCQPDPLLGPRHGLRHADPGQQHAGAGAWAVHHRQGVRPHRLAGCFSIGATGQHRGSGRVLLCQVSLPQGHCPA